MSYADFLAAKVRFDHASGVDVSPDEIHPLLKSHQRATVQWAVRGGCRAIFAQFGLGKSMMQLEILRLLVAKCGGRALINTLAMVTDLSKMGPDLLAKEFTKHTLNGRYSHEDHVAVGEALEERGALPASFMAVAPGSPHPDVWQDVNRMLTLNGEQTRRGLEMHVFPLQFDIVERLIRRYSNAGELVLDPFGGLMTVPLVAMRLGRRATRRRTVSIATGAGAGSPRRRMRPAFAGRAGRRRSAPATTTTTAGSTCS